MSSRIAFVFPGQGSQSVGMLAELAGHYPQVRETFAQASAVLGYDLWQLVQQGPEQALNQTRHTQPAMLAAGVGVWRVWESRGGAAPVLMAGHSLGEYSALVCAGALSFESAVALVAERARLMQEAMPEGQGGMAAVLGLDNDQVTEVCRRASGDEVVEPANLNAPGQVVVAGHSAAVERAIVLAREAGAKRSVRLAVSIPSHCSLMRPAAERLAAMLAQTPLQTPRIPVLHNVDAVTHAEPEAIRRALADQLHRPVRWAETVSHMAERGIDTLIECGPGKVLAGLTKRIVSGLAAYPVFDAATLEQALGGTAQQG